LARPGRLVRPAGLVRSLGLPDRGDHTPPDRGDHTARDVRGCRRGGKGAAGVVGMAPVQQRPPTFTGPTGPPVLQRFVSTLWSTHNSRNTVPKGEGDPGTSRQARRAREQAQTGAGKLRGRGQAQRLAKRAQPRKPP
jgi:hypothetical protein